MTEPAQESRQEAKKPLLRDHKVHLTAAVAGFIVASAVAFIGDTPVAWATPVYFMLGWPVMCAVVYLLARAYPHNSWRWTLSMMLGQVFSSIFFGNASFVLQAMLFVTLLSAPQFVAGTLGARAGNARRSHHIESEHSVSTEDASSQDKL
jgi:hypothetical protein